MRSFSVGTGIGAGILCEGVVLRGADDTAGAIGWLALDRPYRAGYPSVGCFEYQASGAGIATVARTLLPAQPHHRGALSDVDPSMLTAHHVSPHTMQATRSPFA